MQELRKIEAKYYDPENARVIFPPKEAKGKKYHRIIYLSIRAKAILDRLAELRPEGALLVNADGNPWNKDAINCAFCRLQLALGRQEMARRGSVMARPKRFKKAGVEEENLAEAKSSHRATVKEWQKEEQRMARELGTKYHLGAFRKGFATEALKAGVDVVGLAHLMGHRDTSMISRVYGQVQHDPEYMASLSERTKRKKKTEGA